MATYEIFPIDFNILPNPQKDEQGRTTYQVRQDTRGALNTKGLVKHLRNHNMLTQFPIDAIIHTLAEEIVEHLFFNHCVHLDGLGTFSLNIGLSPVVDEDGLAHKRQVTDPSEITGSDIEVTGIAFRPDAEFLHLATCRPAHFRHTEERGIVGHSISYTREELTQSLFAYIDEQGSISRRTLVMNWNLTRYQAVKWLTELTTGDNPPLIKTHPSNAYVYLRNPHYRPET